MNDTRDISRKQRERDHTGSIEINDSKMTLPSTKSRSKIILAEIVSGSIFSHPPPSEAQFLQTQIPVRTIYHRHKQTDTQIVKHRQTAVQISNAARAHSEAISNPPPPPAYHNPLRATFPALCSLEFRRMYLWCLLASVLPVCPNNQPLTTITSTTTQARQTTPNPVTFEGPHHRSKVLSTPECSIKKIQKKFIPGRDP